MLLCCNDEHYFAIKFYYISKENTAGKMWSFNVGGMFIRTILANYNVAIKRWHLFDVTQSISYAFTARAIAI